jgi:hypothetical protein
MATTTNTTLNLAKTFVMAFHLNQRVSPKPQKSSPSHFATRGFTARFVTMRLG